MQRAKMGKKKNEQPGMYEKRPGNILKEIDALFVHESVVVK